MAPPPKNMPEPTRYITGHDQKSGKSIVLTPVPLQWDVVDEGRMPMAVAYVNKMPADLNNDADLNQYQDLMCSPIGLASSGSSVLRYVDLAPGYTCMMHRTQSIDYGVVLEGQAECVMDGGQTQLMGHGDVMVQRFTKHAWKNPSTTDWARILFVLEDCAPLTVDGKTLKEDLGRGASFIPASGNDA